MPSFTHRLLGPFIHPNPTESQPVHGKLAGPRCVCAPTQLLQCNQAKRVYARCLDWFQFRAQKNLFTAHYRAVIFAFHHIGLA
jgi:hypothetical protein